MSVLKRLCTPNKLVSRQVMTGVVFFWTIMFLTFWIVMAPKIIPRPGEVLTSLGQLWQDGVVVELGRSFFTNVKALFYTSLISLGLSYLTVVPAMRPLIAAVGKMRFLGLTGLTLVFTLTIGGGEGLKVSILTFGMTVYFVTYMASVVAAIPREAYDHARTLRMSEWRIVWEVVILGKADEAFEAMRQNAAIGWMMLTMVEGMVRSGGGIGAMLINENKYFNLGAVFGIQILILALGIAQDAAIGFVKNSACPYARLDVERT